MLQVNSLTLTGVVLEKREVQTQNGGTMVSLKCLQEEKVKNKDYTKKVYFSIPCWGEFSKTANNIQQGHIIMVSGKLQVNVYDKKDGSKGYDVQVMPFALGIAGKTQIEQAPPPENQNMSFDTSPGELDDIPF